MASKDNKDFLVSLFLRLGLAFVLIYAAISSLISPQNWIGYLPSFLRASWALTLFSVYEIGLGLWILSNRHVYYASILVAISMFFVIAFNFALLDVVFRDVAIFFMALALAALSKKN